MLRKRVAHAEQLSLPSFFQKDTQGGFPKYKASHPAKQKSQNLCKLLLITGVSLLLYLQYLGIPLKFCCFESVL